MKLTVTHFSYPPHVALLDRALAPLARTQLGDLSVDSMARAAFAHFREPVPSRAERDRLLGAEFDTRMEMLTRADWPPLGRLQYRATLVSAAVNRIRLQRYLDAGRPRAAVRAPIFVVGLPRTGTSLMQRLIAQDPQRRGLRTFELQGPIVDERPTFFGRLKRRAYGDLVSLMYRAFIPELTRIHHTTATSLEECWMLFMSSYSSLVADYLLPHTDFGDALIADGLHEAYGRYKTLLEILSLEAPDKQLVLKSPEHLWFLPALLARFPDARIVWTHRDPAKALPSYSAQVSLPARQHRGAVDPVDIGARVLLRARQGVAIGQKACDDHPAARIAHVGYTDLTARPIEEVRRVYHELELELSSEHEANMRRFLARPQRDKHKNHYRADVFGLEETALRRQFRGYIERFAVASEAELPAQLECAAAAGQASAALPAGTCGASSAQALSERR